MSTRYPSLIFYMNILYVSMCMIYFRPYKVDDGVQLVCKYLRAYDNRSNPKKGINKLYNDNG